VRRRGRGTIVDLTRADAGEARKTSLGEICLGKEIGKFFG
jgi:hypothetical protein